MPLAICNSPAHPLRALEGTKGSHSKVLFPKGPTTALHMKAYSLLYLAIIVIAAYLGTTIA